MGDLYQVLVMQREIRDQKYPDCPYVFFRYGKRIKTFKNAWEEACKRLGTREENPSRACGIQKPRSTQSSSTIYAAQEPATSSGPEFPSGS